MYTSLALLIIFITKAKLGENALQVNSKQMQALCSMYIKSIIISNNLQMKRKEIKPDVS